MNFYLRMLKSATSVVFLSMIALPACRGDGLAEPRGKGESNAPRPDQSAAANPEGWFTSRFDPLQPEMRDWQPARDVESSEVSGFQLIFESTRYPDRVETTEDEARANDLRQQVFTSAKSHGWFDFEQAKRDGYYLMFDDQVHYVNEDFVTDDRTLDPERPEFLLFYETEYGQRLAAAMFLVPDRDEHGPQIAGPLSVWHHHLLAQPRCFLYDLIYIADPGEDGECSSGTPFVRSPEMMHVWFVDHPEGPFGTRLDFSVVEGGNFLGPDWPPEALEPSDGPR